MCYSAQVWQSYQRYVRTWGADIDIEAFYRLYWLRNQGGNVRLAKAMDAAFAEPASAREREIKALIDEWNAREASRFEQELFKQRRRLADAERTLQAKTTKKAQEDRRIATAKVGWALGKLADLRRSELVDADSRIFPGWHAPVLVSERGRLLVRPMRYQCRPAGKPAANDRRFPGTYNARRDSLGGYWKDVFGFSHGVVVANAFFENVSRHAMEGRALAEGEQERNVVLEFRPRPAHDMLVACLWSHWSGAGEALDSFAAITDEPPPEVAAAGHDRCIIPIRSTHLRAWLEPDPARLDAQQAILDDRERPYYEHRLAA